MKTDLSMLIFWYQVQLTDIEWFCGLHTPTPTRAHTHTHTLARDSNVTLSITWLQYLIVCVDVTLSTKQTNKAFQICLLWAAVMWYAKCLDICMCLNIRGTVYHMLRTPIFVFCYRRTRSSFNRRGCALIMDMCSEYYDYIIIFGVWSTM